MYAELQNNQTDNRNRVKSKFIIVTLVEIGFEYVQKHITRSPGGLSCSSGIY